MMIGEVGFVLIVLSCLVSSNKDLCKNEITYGLKTNFSWSIPTTTGFYISIPECKDANGKLIERHCSNSTWTPKYVFCNENLDQHQFTRSTLINNQIETILTFDPRKQNMFLMIYHPETLNSINCFTLISKKIHVDYKLIFDSHGGYSPYFVRRYLVFQLDIFEYPSEYWCEITQINKTILETDKVIGHKIEDPHQEFVVIILFQKGFSFEKFLDACNDLEVFDKCRLMKIDNLLKKAWIHVTLLFKNDQVIKGSFKITYLIQTINLKFKLLKVLSSDFCLPNHTDTNKFLYWNLTPLGEKAKPSQICLDKNGLILTRKCDGNFLEGAYFEEFNKNCSENVSIKTNTIILYEIISKHNFTIETFKNFSSIIKEELRNVTLNDLSLVSDGLFESCDVLESFDDIEDDYYENVDMLNGLNGEILSDSQISLNATDKILDSLEKFVIKRTETIFNESNFNETNLNETNSNLIIKKNNFIIFSTKPKLSNITGLALYGNSTSFLDYNLILLQNETFEMIPKENLNLALKIPQILLDQNNSTLIITIYFNDSLFNEENNTSKANSRIISILMPGLGKYLEQPIPILIRPLTQNEKFIGCGYWQYGTSSPTRKGTWSTKGSEDLNLEDMIYCTYTHLTHFGLLILSGRVNLEQQTSVIVIDSHLPYTKPLNIITIIGCSFSLFGITGIFVTSILFRRFREKIGSKILMLLSIPISLEIILTQLAGIDNWQNNKTVCTTVGILLHYVVLLKFTWMFVIALLQYFRFVKVLGPIPQRIFLKANLICWLLPVIPVVLTAGISPDSYTAGVQKFCYPKDLALYFGLFTPASVIIIFNIMVFGVIMFSISKSKAVEYDKSGKMLRRQTYLAILLFFMLGLPWIFGILAEILQVGWVEITFVYLFCLTATLQGFVLFIFYVVLDKSTRNCWIDYFKHLKK